MHVNLYRLPLEEVYLIVLECKSNGHRLLPYILEMAVKAFGACYQTAL